MKKVFSLCAVLLVLAVGSGISCKKSSADKTNCKTCKVFGGDGPNNVIDEEQICTDQQEQDLHARFPGREIKCQ